jgi:hypothetical protein
MRFIAVKVSCLHWPHASPPTVSWTVQGTTMQGFYEDNLVKNFHPRCKDHVSRFGFGYDRQWFPKLKGKKMDEMDLDKRITGNYRSILIWISINGSTAITG